MADRQGGLKSPEIRCPKCGKDVQPEPVYASFSVTGVCPVCRVALVQISKKEDDIGNMEECSVDTDFELSRFLEDLRRICENS